MCFYIRNNIKSATLWEAKQDIVCYKLLDRNLLSPYQDFQYKFDILVKAKIGKLNSDAYAINSKTGIILNDSSFILSNNKIFNINKGLHSYSNLNVAQKERRFVGRCFCLVFKAIIPKGSEFYYDNVNKEYISNQLIIKKLIK